MNVDIKHSETYIAALQSQCILLEGWRCAAIVTTSFHSFPRTAVVCTAFYMRHSELFALQKEYEAELTFGHRIASLLISIGPTHFFRNSVFDATLQQCAYPSGTLLNLPKSGTDELFSSRPLPNAHPVIADLTDVHFGVYRIPPWFVRFWCAWHAVLRLQLAEQTRAFERRTDRKQVERKTAFAIVRLCQGALSGALHPLPPE